LTTNEGIKVHIAFINTNHLTPIYFPLRHSWRESE